MGFELRRRKRGNPEGALQLQIIHYCKASGYVIGKTKTTGIKRGNSFCFDPYTFRGFPDLVLFTPKFYFLEIKSSTGRQSDDQKEFQRHCINAEIPYLLIRSLSDLEAVLPKN